MGPFYLMESETKLERVEIKSGHDKTIQQLWDTGLLSFENNPSVVDAGCGPGYVAEMMGNVLKNHFEFPRVTLLDFSSEKLFKAESRLSADKSVEYRYVPCNLSRIPLPSHYADYVFCRFVFEYLADPQAVFEELYRLVKPGGKLVIGDLDSDGMNHYPLDPQLAADLSYVMGVLKENNFLDVYAGRKIYSFFRRAQLNDIKAHFYSHHLFCGEMLDANEFNWLSKIDQLIERQKKGTIRFEIDLDGFKTRFLNFLKSPDRFSYTPLIFVEGTKPQ
jgi:ubiquinone/menaquinone biosynthesis C-methylase UbiE